MASSGLMQIATVLWRRRLLFFSVLAIGLLASVVVAMRSHARYVGTATILMVAEPPETQDQKIPSTATKPLLSSDLPSLATSATVLIRLQNDLGFREPMEKFKPRIRAKVSTDSNVMPVSFSASTEAVAIKGANALAAEVARFYEEIATKRFDSLITDLRAQQQIRARQLARYDVELQAAARQYPYIDVHEGDGGTVPQTSVYERLISLHVERDETAALKSADAAGAKKMHERVGEAQPLALSEIVDNDVVYRDERDQYAADLAKLQREKVFALPNYPGFDEMQHTVAREQSAVAKARADAEATGPAADSNYVTALADATKADAQFASDSAKLAEIELEISNLEQKVGGDSVAAYVSQVRRDRENAQTSYSVLAARLAQTIADRAQAASTGSVVVMDLAHFADRAVWTTGTFALVGLSFIALWAAISITLFTDRLYRRFDDDESVQQIYGLPVIGNLS